MLEFAQTRLGRQFFADVHRIAMALEKIANHLEETRKAEDGEAESREEGG